MAMQTSSDGDRGSDGTTRAPSGKRRGLGLRLSQQLGGANSNVCGICIQNAKGTNQQAFSFLMQAGT